MLPCVPFSSLGGLNDFVFKHLKKCPIPNLVKTGRVLNDM